MQLWSPGPKVHCEAPGRDQAPWKPRPALYGDSVSSGKNRAIFAGSPYAVAVLSTGLIDASASVSAAAAATAAAAAALSWPCGWVRSLRDLRFFLMLP